MDQYQVYLAEIVEAGIMDHGRPPPSVGLAKKRRLVSVIRRFELALT